MTAADNLARSFARMAQSSDNANAALAEFVKLYGNPLKKERQPLMGEEMALYQTLTPRPLMLAMHPWAVKASLPPLILKYRGTRTGAVVSSTMCV